MTRERACAQRIVTATRLERSETRLGTRVPEACCTARVTARVRPFAKVRPEHGRARVMRLREVRLKLKGLDVFGVGRAEVASH